MVLEVDLDYLVAKTEHNCVLRSHPLLHIDGARWVLQFVCLVHFISLDQLLFFLWIIVLLQVRFEMLKQRDLLLQFLREVREVVLLHDILLLICCHRLPLVIVELGTTRLSHDLC